MISVYDFFFLQKPTFRNCCEMIAYFKLIIITMNILMPYHFTKTEFRNFTNFLTNQKKRTRHALIGLKIR